MSGECDVCSEHIVDCECNHIPFDKTDEYLSTVITIAKADVYIGMNELPMERRGEFLLAMLIYLDDLFDKHRAHMRTLESL